MQKVTTSAAGSAGEEDPIRLRPVEGGRGRLDKISSNGLAELLHGLLQGQLRGRCGATVVGLLLLTQMQRKGFVKPQHVRMDRCVGGQACGLYISLSIYIERERYIDIVSYS